MPIFRVVMLLIDSIRASTEYPVARMCMVPSDFAKPMVNVSFNLVSQRDRLARLHLNLRMIGAHAPHRQHIDDLNPGLTGRRVGETPRRWTSPTARCVHIAATMLLDFKPCGLSKDHARVP